MLCQIQFASIRLKNLQQTRLFHKAIKNQVVGKDVNPTSLCFNLKMSAPFSCYNPVKLNFLVVLVLVSGGFADLLCQ